MCSPKSTARSWCKSLPGLGYRHNHLCQSHHLTEPEMEIQKIIKVTGIRHTAPSHPTHVAPANQPTTHPGVTEGLSNTWIIQV